jgi:hypothetical protein
VANSIAAATDRPPSQISSHTTSGTTAIRPAVSAFGITVRQRSGTAGLRWPVAMPATGTAIRPIAMPARSSAT